MNVNRLPFLFAFALAVGACGDADAPEARGGWGAAPNVVTVPVELRPLIDEIEALGTARANESVSIRPRVSSIVTRLGFEEGQIVDKGDLLVELENSEIRAGLALAEASLAESRSLYDRSKSLESRQAISASDLDQLLARVRVNEAQVEAARARLANTRIRAPFTGRVGLRNVSPGSYVDSSTEITTLDDIGRIKLDFSVPETFLRVIVEGMNIKARSLVFPDRVFEGTVESVDTRLDPVSRSVLVRAVLPNADTALRPGMFMTVDLQQNRGDVLVVPEEAIVPEGLEQYVFVVQDGVVDKRSVLLGRRIPGFVVIRDGLVAGEEVITEGTNKVRDGIRVEVLEDTRFLSMTGGAG
ncbi:MAG: efflux RND transporter periplasmic adaptor subunit [Woeseiaceae bacterium]|nr:efflux RND transporter periplasmic adaptor subunit [Woeseiaceae bacterium]